MIDSRTAGQGESRSTTKPVDLNAVAIDHAVRLIQQVCCFAGPFDLLGEFRDQALCAAVDRHDTAALFDRLIHDFSFQGISNEIAANYMRRHGQATWRSVRKNFAERPSCPKLQSYWHFHDCLYEKTSRTCAEPDHLAACPLPTHPLRNGHLNQIAYGLYLFIRDVVDGDLVGWIDDRLDQVNDQSAADSLAQVRTALIEPLRNVYGVSDKVLAMALSGILIGAADVRPKWLQVGVHLIAVDTLVHNFLHRTGILARFKAAHPYGPGCYRPGGCAEIIARAAQQIDARAFNPTFPAIFPRFVQLAIWRYCSQQGFDICNGNRLDDRQRCQNRHCRLYAICDRISLK
jgi:hypothetical protein